MKKLSLTLCFIASILALSGWAGLSVSARELPPGLRWMQVDTDHFRIVFQPKHAEIAYKVAGLADAVHRYVYAVLHHAPAGKTYVVLTDHADFVNGYSTYSPFNRIVLYLREPAAGKATYGLHSPDWLATVLTHEYTHIVHMDMAGKLSGVMRKILGGNFLTLPNGRLPLWALEGLAVYTETKHHDGRGRHAYYDMLMRTEILADQFKPLDRMASVSLRSWPMTTSAYLYGYFFTQYLADTYGEESLTQLYQYNSERFLFFGRNAFKRVYDGKDEQTLWREWRDAMQQRYERQIAALRTRPLTVTTPVSDSGYFTNSPRYSPDGEMLYYIESGPHAPSALVRKHLASGKLDRLFEGAFTGTFNLSADGRKIYLSQIDRTRQSEFVSDLYEFDLTSRTMRRLTSGMRAFDPAIAPDGRTLVFTTTAAGSMNLMRMDLLTKTVSPILETTDNTQFASPVFSSDGTRIAVQIWKTGGFQDIYVMDRDGRNLTALTFDRATDASAAWGVGDEVLFFSSDRTGVPNLFAYTLHDRKLHQVTNVLTGVFNSTVRPDGRQIALEYYSGNGMDIHVLDPSQHPWQETAYQPDTLPEPVTATAAVREAAATAKTTERRYAPAASLWPRSWAPIWGGTNDDVQVGGFTRGQDALGYHDYTVFMLYGLSTQRLNVFGEYNNTRFTPKIKLFGSDLTTEFYDLFKNDAGKEKTYVQREQEAGIQISYPLFRTRSTSVDVVGGYRYLRLGAITKPDALTPTPDEGELSGFSAGFEISHLKGSAYGISPERGVLASVNVQHDDAALGSDFTANTLVGDARFYAPLPALRHHVLALRVIGGFSSGDTIAQGKFRLGGDSFESEVMGLKDRQFFLRGYNDNAFAGNRFALASAEYRFPIWYPQRGLGKGWLFFDNLAGVAFYDIGNAWDGDARLSEFKASVGGELRINLGLHYGMLPLTVRLGYAKGLDEEFGQSKFLYDFQFSFFL